MRDGKVVDLEKYNEMLKFKCYFKYLKFYRDIQKKYVKYGYLVVIILWRIYLDRLIDGI